MQKPLLILLIGFLVFGMLFSFPLSIAQEDNETDEDNSGSGSSDEVKGKGVIKQLEVEGGCWAILSNDGQIYEPSNLGSDFQIDGLIVEFEGIPRPDLVSVCQVGSMIELTEIERKGGIEFEREEDEEKRRFRIEFEGERGNEIEIEVEDGERRIKINGEEIDPEEFRRAIRERNRLRIENFTGELPENCNMTGSVIRCEVHGENRTGYKFKGDINLTIEIQRIISQLLISFNESVGEIEIEIEIEKDGDEIRVEIEVEGDLTPEQEELIEELEQQIREFLEGLNRDIEFEIEIKHDPGEDRVMVVTAGESGNIIIQVQGVEMSTQTELYHHNGKVYGIFDDDRAKLINYLPDEIREKIRERIRARIQNQTIELDVDGFYEIQVKKVARLLGIFPVTENVMVEADPETGTIIEVNNPWWGFLANDVE